MDPPRGGRRSAALRPAGLDLERIRDRAGRSFGNLVERWRGIGVVDAGNAHAVRHTLLRRRIPTRVRRRDDGRVEILTPSRYRGGALSILARHGIGAR